MYLGQVCIDVATLQWGKFVYLGRVCKCGESSVIQTCPIVKSPQFKLAPNTNSPHFLCMVSTLRAWFVLVVFVFYHRSNVYPALQVMVLVNKRRDRSMLCVLSHVNNAIELY